MEVIDLSRIKSILQTLDIIPIIEAGFSAYAQGKAIIPPVGELLFTEPSGDMHIKYGYIKGDEVYVVKIASGFYENSQYHLPTSNGLMLVFDRKTGKPLALLQDEGYLTDIRTAAAGAIVAKYLAPKQVNCIGIIGTGVQARLQLQYLQKVLSVPEVRIYGRNQAKLLQLQNALAHEAYSLTITQSMQEITTHCELIVTTTPSQVPLLLAEQIRPGTHITAVGADATHKQELESAIFAKADIVVADSLAQCRERGDIAHALRQGMIQEQHIIELGHLITGSAIGRVDEKQITVADLTGVAVQDIQIAKLTYSAHASLP